MRQSIKPSLPSSLYFKLLVAKRADLLAELDSRREDIDGLRGPVPEEDQPAMVHELSITARLSVIESSELTRVNTALEKLRTGTYGACERCGGPIPTARLKAIPWAPFCHKCEALGPQEQIEAVGRAN